MNYIDYLTDEKDLDKASRSVIVQWTSPRDNAKLSNAIYHLWRTIDQYMTDQGKGYSEASNHILSIDFVKPYCLTMHRILFGLKNLPSHHPSANYVKALKL